MATASRASSAAEVSGCEVVVMGGEPPPVPGWTLDTPDRVDRMVLMGPGGIGTTRVLPTPGQFRLSARSLAHHESTVPDLRGTGTADD